MREGTERRALVVALVAAALVPAAARAADDKDSDRDRPYPHGTWQGDCVLCHRSDHWLPAQPSSDFKHPKTFPLDGAHKTAGCRACHVSLDFNKVGRSCVECHQDVHVGEFGTDCARCHTTRDFVDRSNALRLHRTGRFPLTGAHLAADCEACHRTVSSSRMTFLGVPTDCASCHARPGFPAATQRPADHVSGNFPLDCSQCHNTISFGDAKFDHSRTRLPLTGAHAALACSQCHGAPFRRGLDPACSACHMPQYNATTDPNHRQAGFPTDCALCHNTTSFSGARFDHSTTKFPLTGAHTTLGCAQCHGDGVYRGKPTACVSCHQQDFDRTTDPDHRRAGFSTDCTLCHNTTSFAGAAFDHNRTQFPLTGAHAALDCKACHADGVFNRPTECVSCHQKDYDGTRDPNHRQAGFPTDCRLCHTMVSWSGANFDHRNTNFPLTGAHAGLGCNACHADGVYRGKSTACISCHQDDYNRATDPNHRAASFPTDCTLCHSTTSWAGAQFDHNRTQFPLTGAHAALPCSACHADNVYRGKPTTCVSCHRQDYDRTTDPNHRAASFSTDCTQCHNTTAFDGARYTEHDARFFPIYSGTHRGHWDRCSDCHQVNTNYAAFSCTTCHAKSDTDREHRNVSGYAYDSNACYRCHPQGRAEG